MPVPDFAIVNSPDDLQRSTFRDISPTELDQVLPPPNNYVYPLPELPQAPPPPLQLAYIPPLSVLFFPMPPSMPEPPVLHKVWILDCKSCGKFLTNRGMKAVLLLRPHVPLYSTDAMPVNCSVYNAPAPRHSSRSSAHSSRARSSGSSSGGRDREEAPRTCECLTQTLSCHGCGAQVGYMIVSPCSKCTSSTFSPSMHFGRTPHSGNNVPPFMPPLMPSRNRATNGHRFVFHSSEVVGEERLYVSGEPGVIPDADPYENTEHDNTFSTPVAQFAPYGGAHAQVTNSGNHVSNSQAYAAQVAHSYLIMPPLRSPPSMPNGPESQRFFQTFPLERTPHNSGDSTGSNMSAHSRSSSRRSSVASPVRSPPPSRSSAHTDRAPSYAAFPPLQPIPSIHQYPGSPSMQATPPPSAPKAPKIRGGDVLFWHHLSRRGELPGVYDDERSRPNNGGRLSDHEDDDKGRLPGVAGAIVCGR